jgi:hypothetical protein
MNRDKQTGEMLLAAGALSLKQNPTSHFKETFMGKVNFGEH